MLAKSRQMKVDSGNTAAKTLTPSACVWVIDGGIYVPKVDFTHEAVYLHSDWSFEDVELRSQQRDPYVELTRKTGKA